nr:lecithin retinol acyltransferase family protein [uncultured Fluviicola sp.]
MNKINYLISKYNLRIIDAIVLRKRFIGMVDHYVLFGGYSNENQPIFLANYKTGVQFVPHSDMVKYLSMLEPERIVPFKGNENERLAAIERAKSRIGERAYDYVTNNCEHFVTWVHTGKHSSKQVADVGVGLMIVGAVSTIGGGMGKKNDVALVIGIGALLLGALLKFGFNDSKEI